MKTKLGVLTLISLSAVFTVITSCSKNDDVFYTVDYGPINIVVCAVNSDNEYIFDIDNKENLLNSGFQIIYKNEAYFPDYRTYTFGWEPTITKYLPAHFYGGWVKKSRVTNSVFLFIGGFPGDESFDESVILDWGNSKKDVIRVVHKFGKNKKTTYYLNGALINGKIISITR